MNYLDITYPDINNGLGIRATIWFAGCPFHCEGCHNKETWNYNQGKHFDAEYVFNEILLIIKEHPYISGITLSGGDPIGACNGNKDNYEALISFLHMFREEFPDKDIWIYSGAYYDELLKNEYKMRILHLCNYIVDGPFEIDKRDITLPFRGSSNQRIVKNNSGIFEILEDSYFKD